MAVKTLDALAQCAVLKAIHLPMDIKVQNFHGMKDAFMIRINKTSNDLATINEYMPASVGAIITEKLVAQRKYVWKYINYMDMKKCVSLMPKILNWAVHEIPFELDGEWLMLAFEARKGENRCYWHCEIYPSETKRFDYCITRLFYDH